MNRIARLSRVLFVLACVLTLGSRSAMAADYVVDSQHSHVGFSVRHLVSKVPGSFQKFDAEFSFDEKKIADSKGKFTIQAASISTNDSKRDAHLQSADFFDVKKFPTITFESTKVVSKGKNRFALEGNLTLHGVTKPATFDVEYLGSSVSPFNKKEVVGFTAKSKINRKDYNIVWNKTLDSGGVVIGEDVEIEIQIEAYAK